MIKFFKILFALAIFTIFMTTGTIIMVAWKDYCTINDCVGGDIGN